MAPQQGAECNHMFRNTSLHAHVRRMPTLPTTSCNNHVQQLTIMGGTPPHFNDRLPADNSAGETSRWPPEPRQCLFKSLTISFCHKACHSPSNLGLCAGGGGALLCQQPPQFSAMSKQRPLLKCEPRYVQLFNPIAFPQRPCQLVVEDGHVRWQVHRRNQGRALSSAASTWT